MNKIFPKIETVFLVSIGISGIGVAYLRTYWGVFGINIFNNISVAEIGLAGINAGLTVVGSVLFLALGFILGRKMFNLFNHYKQLHRIYFVLLPIWISLGIIITLLDISCHLYIGHNLELVVIGSACLLGLTIVNTMLFFKRKTAFTKRLETYIVIAIIASAIDAWEDAKQIQYGFEYEWVCGDQLKLSSSVKFKVLGKMGDTYFFLDESGNKHEMQLEELMFIKSFDIEKSYDNDKQRILNECVCKTNRK